MTKGQCLKLSFPGPSRGVDSPGPRGRPGGCPGRAQPKERAVGSVGWGCSASWAPHHRLSTGHVSLGWETFLLFVTGINRFHNGFFCGFFFYEGNSSLCWASALNLVTSAPSIVLREAGKIQHGFSKEKFVNF